MPEGDAIRHAAIDLGAALVGKPVVSVEAPQPRHAHDRIAERLAGRAVRSVDAHGKHLFVRFDGDLTLHSHLRMRGAWRVYRRGERWRRAAHRAWLVLRTPDHEVVQFDGPVLELIRSSRANSLVASLGPDILAQQFDERHYLRRLRDDDQTRTLGAALLDQRNVAGIGNIWKSEGCFLAGVSPFRRLRDMTDDELLAVPRALRPPMLDSVPHRGTWVYRRARLPCRRCAGTVASRRQGDDNRTTYWCERCQR